jgi:c-di-GMP-binding flagellar brake protein YcgR
MYNGLHKEGCCVSQDRRQHYRVTPNIEREVHVFAIATDGTSQQVGLLDISAGGVSFGVEADQKLVSEVGENLTLRFETGRSAEPLEIAALLCHIKLVEGNLIYGISFAQWDGDRQSLAPQLRSLFNEREAVRVEPQEDHEVEMQITLHGRGTITHGLLRDISVLGIGVWVADEDQEMLGNGENLTIDLHLPSEDEVLQLNVVVRHTQHVGQRMRVGAQMLSQDIRLSREQTKRITNYVMKRQIQVARIDAERRRAMQAHYPTR